MIGYLIEEFGTDVPFTNIPYVGLITFTCSVGMTSLDGVGTGVAVFELLEFPLDELLLPPLW